MYFTERINLHNFIVNNYFQNFPYQAVFYPNLDLEIPLIWRDYTQLQVAFLQLPLR